MNERPAPVPGVDPLFTDADATEIIEYLEDEALLCPGCHQPLIETTAIENTWAYKGETMQCHSCAAKERAYSGFDDRAGVFAFSQPKDQLTFSMSRWQ